jgi:hypothetical protein
MTPLWLFLSLVTLGLVGGGGGAAPRGGIGDAPLPVAPAAPVAEDRWLEFAAYPGARKLCSQHVSGNTMHISWTAYATTDHHRKVIDFYVKRHGGKPEGDTLTLSGSKGVKLSVHPADKGGYPTCEVKPAKSDKTVILVSQATGPGVK